MAAQTTLRRIDMLGADDYIHSDRRWYRCAGPAAATPESRTGALAWSVPVQNVEGKYLKIFLFGDFVTSTLGGQRPPPFGPSALLRRAGRARDEAAALIARAEAFEELADRACTATINDDDLEVTAMLPDGERTDEQTQRELGKELRDKINRRDGK